MPAPSVAVYKDAYTDSGTSALTRVLTQRTVATGDVVCVVWQNQEYASGGGAGYNTPTLAQTAGTAVIAGLTKAQDAGASTYCNNALWTCTVTTGGTLTFTVSFVKQGTPGSNFNTAWMFVATGSAGVGVTGKNAAGYTATIVPAAHSVIVAMASDWSSAGSATTTLTPAGYTVPLDAHETDGVADQSTAGSVYASRGGHWADSAAGSAAYGVASPSSAKYNVVVCEFLAGLGGGPTAAAAENAAAAASVDGAAVVAGTALLYAGSAAGVSGSWVNTAGAVGSTQGDYATWTDSGAGTSATLELATFNAQAAVPAGSTVNDVKMVIRHGDSPAAAVASVTAQAYSGAAPVGAPQALTVADAPHDDVVTFTGLSYADLADLRVRVTVTRA